ncbi:MULTISPECIES: hypothetical protein [unclassified Clostridium]|uniref:hypothetical protein n=1 Tax=unclassified Clostridium TaxID=2614128 RepID=UPI0025C04BA1|nr:MULTISPECIES: hypothetical protein [unclassified Clostridium]
MLDMKIYSSWAFTENEEEKARVNYEIYNEIKNKAKVECIASGQSNVKYKIVSNPDNLSTLELALICDRGNLCFGYRTEGEHIVIYTD